MKDRQFAILRIAEDVRTMIGVRVTARWLDSVVGGDHSMYWLLLTFSLDHGVYVPRTYNPEDRQWCCSQSLMTQPPTRHCGRSATTTTMAESSVMGLKPGVSGVLDVVRRDSAAQVLLFFRSSYHHSQPRPISDTSPLFQRSGTSSGDELASSKRTQVPYQPQA